MPARRGDGATYYVMIERQGLDITPTCYTDKTKPDEQKVSVAARNAQIAKQNRETDVEIATLRKSLQAKTLELVKAVDDAAKVTLKAEIEGLKSQIAGLEASKKPAIILVGPTKFGTREEADAYVDQVKQAALRLKAKADASKSSTQARVNQ